MSEVSKEFYTMLIAMAPISELRGAIPWALTLGGLGWGEGISLLLFGELFAGYPSAPFSGSGLQLVDEEIPHIPPVFPMALRPHPPQEWGGGKV